MHLLVAWRRNALDRIREPDDEVMLSNEMLADMLLETTNSPTAQQQVVIVSISSVRVYDEIAEVLVFQLPTVEKPEAPRKPPAKTYPPAGKEVSL